MGKLVRKMELAEILGVSDRTLSLWQRDSIDPMPIAQEGRQGVREQLYDTEAVIGWMIRKEVGKLGVGADGKTYDFTAERGRLTFWQAEEKELAVKVLRRTLIPSEEVKTVWSRLVIVMKTTLLALPDRLARLLAAAEDFQQRREMLDAEIRDILNNLSKYQDEGATSVSTTATDDAGDPDESSGGSDSGSSEAVRPAPANNRKRVGRRKSVSKPGKQRASRKVPDSGNAVSKGTARSGNRPKGGKDRVPKVGTGSVD